MDGAVVQKGEILELPVDLAIELRCITEVGRLSHWEAGDRKK